MQLVSIAANPVPDGATVGTIAPSGTVAAPVVDAFTNGWFSDAAAWPQAILWALALIALAVATWRLGLVWGKQWLTIAIAVLPFLVLLYFFFENAAEKPGAPHHPGGLESARAESLGQFVRNIAAANDNRVTRALDPLHDRQRVVHRLKVEDAFQRVRPGQWIGPPPGRDEQRVVRKNSAIGEFRLAITTW